MQLPENVVDGAGVEMVVPASPATTGPPGIAQPSAVLSDEKIDGVVAELNDLCRARGLELTLSIGKLIADRFFDGDVKLLRSRAEQDLSLRKLAERAESGALHISASTLYRAIGIFELTARLGVASGKHLGVSHLRAVIGLPFARQQRLLTAAEDEGWTSERLEAEVRATRTKSGDAPRGRPPSPAFVKGIGRLARMLAESEAAFGDLDRIDQLDAAQAAALRETVVEMRNKCEELEERLKAAQVAPAHRPTRVRDP